MPRKHQREETLASEFDPRIPPRVPRIPLGSRQTSVQVHKHKRDTPYAKNQALHKAKTNTTTDPASLEEAHALEN